MEEPVAADGDDHEYMTMDPDKWSEHVDIYENGDTLGHSSRGEADSSECESGPDSRGQKKEKLKIEKVATDRQPVNTQNSTTARPRIPPTDRYITIQRPQMSANGRKDTPQLVFLRRAVVYLTLLCMVSLVGLLILTIWHFSLDDLQLQRVCQEIQSLKKKMDKA